MLAGASPIEHLKEEWRVSIAQHLEREGRAVYVHELGSLVPRPRGLGANQKVVDVLRGDPQGRFAITGEGHELSVMLLDAASVSTPSPSVASPPSMLAGASPIEHLKEEWRVSIAQHLEREGRAVYVHELGSLVPRPRGLGANQKVVDVLRGDPQGRFAIMGEGLELSVSLRDVGDDCSLGSFSFPIPPSSAAGYTQSLASHSQDGVPVKIRVISHQSPIRNFLRHAVDYEDLRLKARDLTGSDSVRIFYCDRDEEEIEIEGNDDVFNAWQDAMEQNLSRLTVTVSPVS